MLIDPLNIFPEIKDVLVKYVKVPVKLYAIGSRTKGYSSGGKWDFDILIISEDKLDVQDINKFVKIRFKYKVDENNKPVSIDIFCKTNDMIEKYKITTETYKHAHLL